MDMGEMFIPFGGVEVKERDGEGSTTGRFPGHP